MKLTLGKLFVVILFVSILFLVLRPITDADFWWHLATGRWMAETGQIPQADPFSYTAAGKTWIAHEWLSEKLMFLLYQVGGYGALILAFSLLITLAYAFAYFRSPVLSRPYIAGFITLLAAASSAPLWGVRPQMFTLLISSAFLLLLDRYSSERKKKWLIWLPLLMLAWVNLHAGYFIGLVIIGIHLFAVVLEYFVARVRKKETSRELITRAGWLASTLVMSTAVTLVNPNGARILLYPFETLSDPAMQTYIQEWYPPDFNQLIWLPFLLSLIAIIGLGVFGKKRLSLPNIFLLLVFGYLGLRSMRHVPLFAVAAAPILAEMLQAVIPGSEKLHLAGRKSWLFTLLALLLILPLGLKFYRTTLDQPKAEQTQYPYAAVEWIRQHKPVGNLFNSYTWGGYLIWQLTPDYPVYIDGRADLYGSDFFEEFAAIYQARMDYQAVFAENQVRLVLVEPDSGIARELNQSSEWMTAFKDENSILFVAK